MRLAHPRWKGVKTTDGGAICLFFCLKRARGCTTCPRRYPEARRAQPGWNWRLSAGMASMRRMAARHIQRCPREISATPPGDFAVARNKIFATQPGSPNNQKQLYGAG